MRLPRQESWLREAAGLPGYPYTLAARLPELLSVLTESRDDELRGFAVEGLADLCSHDGTARAAAIGDPKVLATLSKLSRSASDATLRMQCLDTVRVLMSSAPTATVGPAARSRRRGAAAVAAAKAGDVEEAKVPSAAAPTAADASAPSTKAGSPPSNTLSLTKQTQHPQKKKRRPPKDFEIPRAASMAAMPSPAEARRQRLPMLGSVLIGDELADTHHRAGQTLQGADLGFAVPLVWAPQDIRTWRMPAEAGDLRMVSRRDVPPQRAAPLPSAAASTDATNASDAREPPAKLASVDMRAIIAGAASSLDEAGAAAAAEAEAVEEAAAALLLPAKRAPPRESWAPAAEPATDANFTTQLLDGMGVQLARAQQSHSSAQRAVQNAVLAQRTTDIALLRFRLERARESNNEDALRVAERDYAHWVRHFCLPKLGRLVATARRLQLRAALVRMRNALEHVAFFQRLPHFRLRAAAALLHEPMLLAFERFTVERTARRFRFWRDLVRSEAQERLAAATLPIQRVWRCSVARARTTTLRMGHWGANVLQTAYRRLYRRKAFLHVRGCLFMMQSVFRMFSWRRWFKGVRRHAMRQQSMGRMIPLKLKYKKMRSAVRILQNQLRAHLGRMIVETLRLMRWRNSEQRWTAALAIQRARRGILARRMTSHTLNDQHHVFQAALMLQRTWYRHNDEFSTWILLCALRVRDELDRVSRRTDRHDERALSATKIQSLARGIMMKIRFMQTRAQLRSALVVQMTWRAWKARIWFLTILRTWRAAKSLQRAIRRRQLRRYVRACRIQRAWWRWSWRSLRAYAHDAPTLTGAMRGLRFRTGCNPAAQHLIACAARAKHNSAKARRKAMDDAVDTLARGWRCHFSRHRLTLHLKARDVQRSARGHAGRQRATRTYYNYRVDAATRILNVVFPRVLPRAAQQLWWHRRVAAIKIQNFTREFLVRLRWRRAVALAVLRDRSAKTVQRGVRVWWGHRSLLVVRKRLREMASNEFGGCADVGAVLRGLRTRCASLWSSEDATVGMSLAAWFRRIGVVNLHAAASTARRTCGATATVQEMLAALRAGGEQARVLKKAVGAEDWATCLYFLELDDLAASDDFRVATTAEAEEMFLERFPGKAIRAKNWAASALLPESGLSKRGLQLLLKNSAESGEPKHRIQGLLTWEDDDTWRGQEEAFDKERSAQFIRLHLTALRRCADIAEVKCGIMDTAVVALAELGAPSETMRTFLESAAAQRILRRLNESFGPARNCPSAWRKTASICEGGKRPLDAAEATRLHAAIAAVETANRAAVFMQTAWRARMGRQRLLAIRRAIRLDELRYQYSEEAMKDKVREAWEAEREKERIAYEEYTEDQRRIGITEALRLILPYGWAEAWDPTEEAAYYTDPDGDVTWERPTYTWKQDDAVVIIQRRRRGILGRKKAFLWTMFVGRQRRRAAAATVWVEEAPTRARRVTLQLAHDARDEEDATNSDAESVLPPTPSSRHYVGEKVECIVDQVAHHRRHRDWLRAVSFSIANLAAEKSERRQLRKRTGRSKKEKKKRVKYKPDLRSELRALAKELVAEAIAGIAVYTSTRAAVMEAHPGELLPTFGIAASASTADAASATAPAVGNEPAAPSAQPVDASRRTTFAFVPGVETTPPAGVEAASAAASAAAPAAKSEAMGKQSGKQSGAAKKKGKATKGKNGASKRGRKKKTSSAAESSASETSEPLSDAAAPTKKTDNPQDGTGAGGGAADDIVPLDPATMLARVRQDTVDIVSSFLRSCLAGVFIEVDERARVKAENRAMVKSLTKEFVKECCSVAIESKQEKVSRAERIEEESHFRTGWITKYNEATGRHLIIVNALPSPPPPAPSPTREEEEEGESHNDDIVAAPTRAGARQSWYWCTLADEQRHCRLRLVHSDRVQMSVGIEVTWICRFGWRSPESEIPEDRYYWNEQTGETSWSHPDYEYRWVAGCIMAQRMWRMICSKRHVRRLLGAEPVDGVLQRAIQRSMKAHTWMGYGIEGMSPHMWLARLGFPDLAETLFGGSKKSPLLIAELRSIDAAELGECVHDLAKQQGLHRAQIGKFVKLMAACTKQREAGRGGGRGAREISLEQRALALVSGPDSAVTRSPTGVLLHVAEGPLTLFKRVFPNYAGARCVGFANVMSTLHPPISIGALENHLQKYAGKAATAQSELTQLKATAFQSAAEAEQRCARAYFTAVDRVAVLAANMPVLRLYADLRRTCSAARAELDALESRSIAETLCDAAVLPRSHGGSTGYMPLALMLRKKMDEVFAWVTCAMRVQTFQRCHVLRRRYARIVAMKATAATVIQCTSRCFLSRRRHYEAHLMFHAEWEQCWEPQQGAFFYFHMETEEVRWTLEEGVAFRPFGMWPQIAQNQAAPPPDAGMCSWCRDRRAVRQCRQCADPGGASKQFCFLCYVRVHTDPTDETKKAHRWDPLEGAGEPSLVCVTCSAESERWCEDCGEAFCEPCHSSSHKRSKRKRAHRWRSLFRNAPACAECASQPAKRHCDDCADSFCVSCFDSVHAKGYRRRHAHTPVRAVPVGEQTLCSICDYALGSKQCIHCTMALCPGCLEFEHPPMECPELDLDIVAAEEKIAAASAKCIECGVEATRMCDQTSKAYCSVRWIGNPGCFEKEKTARGARGKKWTCSMHPGVKIRQANMMLQAIGRGVHARSQYDKLRMERASKVLGRATRRFLLRRAGKLVHQNKKSIKGKLMRGAQRLQASVWRARHADEVGLSKRNTVFEMVKNTWDAAEGNAQDLDEAILAEMTAVNMAEDRRDTMLRLIRADVLAFHRARMLG
jgi:hypothetical protein